MKSIRSRGFTLIELLVVIAIIGLLASIILASLNTARQKGRDARRVADLKEMANAMELANNGTLATPLAPAGCVAGSANVNVCTTPNLALYADPSVGAAGTLCTHTTAAGTACQYAIGAAAGLTTAGATTQNYEICTSLESGAGGFTNQLISISSASSGNIVAGCL